MEIIGNRRKKVRFTMFKNLKCFSKVEYILKITKKNQKNVEKIRINNKNYLAFEKSKKNQKKSKK